MMVVIVLPPVVSVEKVVSVEIGVKEPEPFAALAPPVGTTAEVAGREPTVLPALEADAAATDKR